MIGGVSITGNSIGTPYGSNTGYIFQVNANASSLALSNLIAHNLIPTTQVTMFQVNTSLAAFKVIDNLGYYPTPTLSTNPPVSGTTYQKLWVFPSHPQSATGHLIFIQSPGIIVAVDSFLHVIS